MNDILKEALKDIPTIKSDLLISAYGSIDLDELNKTVERLNKIPNYDDLMKENQKLQSSWNSLRELVDYQLKHNVGSSAESSIRNHVYQEIKDKMNELERKDKDGTMD